MSAVSNRAAVAIAKGYIAKEDVGHNRDAFELLFRAVSDVNALWVLWAGAPVLVNRGPDWARALGSASLMERLAERAARDCIAGLLNADISDAVGKDDDTVEILDKELNSRIAQQLDTSASTLVLLQNATQTLHTQSLPAAVIGQQAKLWSDVPSIGAKYQYDSVSVGSAKILNYVKEAGTTDAVYLNPMRQVRLHMTEVGRKRRRLAYGEAVQPLIESSIRDAGYTWNRRVEMFRAVHAKASSAFCDREGAFLALPNILRHMHAGTVDKYIDDLPVALPTFPLPCELSDFIEYHPVVRLGDVKDELSLESDRVEFSSDGRRWHVGHGATLSADVWAALCSLAMNPGTQLIFEQTRNDSAPAELNQKTCDFVRIAMVDDEPVSHRPAHFSYTLEVVTAPETTVNLTVLHLGERHRLTNGEQFRIDLPENGSWVRISVAPQIPDDDQPPATFRFRAPPADESIISPVCIGVDSDDGPFRDGQDAYASALPGFRRRELPLTLMYAPPNEGARTAALDANAALLSNFEGFMSVSDEDSRRVAYAAKRMQPEEAPPGVDASEIPPAIKIAGPTALFTPMMAWVRSHDGVATLCTVHYNQRQRYRPTPLQSVALNYVRDSIRDNVDFRNQKLLAKAISRFNANFELYDGAVAAAAELIIATSRSTVYHDAKAVEEAERQLRREVGTLIATAELD